jgi:NAD(P)-dependent dehydrogenase (short-subunit alcohol dehydrogenase family)
MPSPIASRSLQADLTDQSQIGRVLAKREAVHGLIDVLVNNAG